MTEPADEAPSAEELRRRRNWLKQRVARQPHDLDLRHELAAVYRAEGNAPQAGRWDYLSETADPQETSAFAHMFRDDPIALMRALRWTGFASDAGTEVARERLRRLQERAADRVGFDTVTGAAAVRHSGSWESTGVSLLDVLEARLGCAGAAVALALVVGLVVVGAVTVVRWVVGLG